MIIPTKSVNNVLRTLMLSQAIDFNLIGINVYVFKPCQKTHSNSTYKNKRPCMQQMEDRERLSRILGPALRFFGGPQCTDQANFSNSHVGTEFGEKF